MKFSNLLSDGNTVDLVFKHRSEAKVDGLKTDGLENKISATVYGNDFSSITSVINLTGSTGISA